MSRLRKKLADIDNDYNAPKQIGKLIFDSEMSYNPLYGGIIEKNIADAFNILLKNAKKVDWMGQSEEKGIQGLINSGNPIILNFDFGEVELNFNEDYIHFIIDPYFSDEYLSGDELKNYIEKLISSANAFNKSFGNLL